MQPLFYMRHASCDSPPPYAGQQYNWFQLLCEMSKHMVKEHMKQSVEYCFHDDAQKMKKMKSLIDAQDNPYMLVLMFRLISCFC